MEASDARAAGRLVTTGLLLLLAAGVANPAVTQSTIGSTICVSGWASTVRPPVSYTTPIKRRLLDEQHPGGRMADYQLDHIISLELGGDPKAPGNLQLEPIVDARAKDGIENLLNGLVCSGKVTLRQAQTIIRAVR